KLREELQRHPSASELVDHLQNLHASLQTAADRAGTYCERFDALIDWLQRSASATDFRFLMNDRRKLFAIGWNADEKRLDRSHYDMLCSEARLASYIAIAKGDADVRHWYQLGRQSTEIDGKLALLSWGGTMFEYLMPPLFQRQYEGSLLTQSCRC